MTKVFLKSENPLKQIILNNEITDECHLCIIYHKLREIICNRDGIKIDEVIYNSNLKNELVNRLKIGGEVFNILYDCKIKSNK